MGVALGQGASEWGGACAAVVEGGAPRVVENDHGQRRTPSVVAFADSGETLVGQPAKKLLFSRTATAVRGFEAILGVRHDSDECRRLIAEAALPYALAADDRGFAAVHCARTPPLTSALASRPSPTRTHRHASPVQVLATLHPPAELSAAVIEALRRASESALGGRSVLSAAIGAPALASDALRDALVAAGRRAGLQQIEIVDEHLAAARAAEHELPAALADARTLGVYDLGARAFSFGVLRRADGADGGGGGGGGGGRRRRRRRWLGGGGGAARGAARVGGSRRRSGGPSGGHLPRRRGDRPDGGPPGIAAAARGGGARKGRAVRRALRARLAAVHLGRRRRPQASGAHDLAGRLRPPRIADARRDALPLCADARRRRRRAGRARRRPRRRRRRRAPALCAAVAGFFGREPIRPERPEEAVALGAALYAAEFQERKFSSGGG